MTDTELVTWEATRDFQAELVESVTQMVDGQVSLVYSPVVQARKSCELTQSAFARFLGVSVRTLREWEQGRKHPKGAAKIVIAIALAHADVLKGLAVNQRV